MQIIKGNEIILDIHMSLTERGQMEVKWRSDDQEAVATSGSAGGTRYEKRWASDGVGRRQPRGQEGGMASGGVLLGPASGDDGRRPPSIGFKRWSSSKRRRRLVGSSG
jgi:hypothetical protein